MVDKKYFLLLAVSYLTNALHNGCPRSSVLLLFTMILNRLKFCFKMIIIAKIIVLERRTLHDSQINLSFLGYEDTHTKSVII